MSKNSDRGRVSVYALQFSLISSLAPPLPSSTPTVNSDLWLYPRNYNENIKMGSTIGDKPKQHKNGILVLKKVGNLRFYQFSYFLLSNTFQSTHFVPSIGESYPIHLYLWRSDGGVVGYDEQKNWRLSTWFFLGFWCQRNVIAILWCRKAFLISNFWQNNEFNFLQS